jgi:hypothetical protein
MASAGEDRVVRVWTMPAMAKRAELGAPGEPTVVSWDRDGWRLWVLCEGSLLAVFDIGSNSGLRHGPITCFPLQSVLGGTYLALQTQAGDICVCADGSGEVTVLRLRNAAFASLPPPDPLPPPEPGTILIAGSCSADGRTFGPGGSETDEFLWEEYSGPLGVVLRRSGGKIGRVSAEFTTAGTNDDDPDYTPTVEVVEWADGDDADQTVWLAMRSFNTVEWDSLAKVWLDIQDPTAMPDKSDSVPKGIPAQQGRISGGSDDGGKHRIRVDARLAAFSKIMRVDDRVAHCSLWHPPLMPTMPNLTRAEAEVRDAERAFLSGADGSAERRARSIASLQALQALGTDAEVGLTGWPMARGAIAVVQASDEMDFARFSDPSALHAAFSAFCLDAARCAERAGANALLVVGPAEQPIAAKWPDTDKFDERTGRWTAANFPVSITVASIGLRARELGSLREGSMVTICPEAPNDAFRRRTGIEPRVQLHMAGDETFEVLLKGPGGGATLDLARSRAAVRILNPVEADAHRARGIASQAGGAEAKEMLVSETLAAVELLYSCALFFRYMQ